MNSRGNEVRHFFRSMTELQAALIVEDEEQIYEWLDEMDVLALHTDSVRLKAKIEKILVAHRFVERREAQETKRTDLAQDNLAIASSKGDIQSVNTHMKELCKLISWADVPSNRDNAMRAVMRCLGRLSNA